MVGVFDDLTADSKVLDVSDLAALAQLPDVQLSEQDRHVGFFDPGYQHVQDRARFVRWVAEARALAAAGVRPAPSHDRPRWVDDDDDRMFPSLWGAFADVGDVAAELEAAGLVDRGAPLVMFGFVFDADQRFPETKLPYLPAGFDWRAVAAQTAGMVCAHRQMVGIPLAPHRELAAQIWSLARFADRDGHRCFQAARSNTLWGPSLSTLASYHEMVGEFGWSAERVWDVLEEGLSPLDVECAEMLSDTVVPSDEQLAPPPRSDDADDDADDAEPDGESDVSDGEWLSGMRAARWCVAVFGPNCD